MNCPNCGCKTEVTHTRSSPDYNRRRRLCRECGEVSVTYETFKPPGERYPMGHPWTQKEKPEKRQKPKHRYCEYNPVVVCEEGNRCATCGWNPCKKNGG